MSSTNLRSEVGVGDERLVAAPMGKDSPASQYRPAELQDSHALAHYICFSRDETCVNVRFIGRKGPRCEELSEGGCK